MATYTEIAALRRNSILKDKVSVAVSVAAMDIRNEAESAPNHRARKRWADQAIVNPEGQAEAMLWAVLGNPSIQATGEASPDGDVQFVVNGLVDTFAQ